MGLGQGDIGKQTIHLLDRLCPRLEGLLFYQNRIRLGTRVLGQMWTTLGNRTESVCLEAMINEVGGQFSSRPMIDSPSMCVFGLQHFGRVEGETCRANKLCSDVII